VPTGPLRIDRDEGVVTLTLDRPHVKNAIDAELMQALTAAVTDHGADEDVRALVLTGSGDVFSAGADLSWMAAVADASDADNREDSRTFERMLRAVHDAPVPVLARVNGHAIAGASGLIACADIVVAVRGARFGFTEARLGLVPAMVSSYVLPRIGAGNARRYFLTGELFDADRARELGLVHEVCEPDDLDAVFAEVVDHVLAAGPQAQRETKRLLPLVAAGTSPSDTEDLRVETITRARASAEAQQRIRAFLDQRER
jgi:methylglutaconyl-CoA hydratase